MAALTAAALAALLGGGLTAYNGVQTAKKQDKVAAQGIRKQAEDQRQINARLNQTLDQTKKSTSADEKVKASAAYHDQLGQQLQRATAGLTQRGVSDQYDALAGDASKSVGDYGSTIADLFARMDAPLAQRRNEGNTFNELARDTSVMSRNSAGDDFLNQLKLKAIHRNPWIDGLAAAASGYASASAASASGGASTNAFGMPSSTASNWGWGNPAETSYAGWNP